MGFEYAWATRKKQSAFRFTDSIASLNLGSVQHVLEVAATSTLLTTHHFLEHFRIFPEWNTATTAGKALTGLATFLAVDFIYYWFHRWSHRVNFLWASHLTHHQSEEYNLSTALRQSAINWLLFFPFLAFLILLGAPVTWVITCWSLNLLYQFWFHTRLVPKLGWLESILNTPSHHRVHHGRNPKYIDRNHGGVFIFWDHLFGTFQEEEEEPVYGLVHPLQSFSPWEANVHHWRYLWQTAKSTQAWKNKFKIWFAPPEWRPLDVGGPFVIPEPDTTTAKFDVANPSKKRKVYLLGVYVAATLALVIYQSWVPKTGLTPSTIALGISILWSFWALPKLFESSTKAELLEPLRWGCLLATSVWVLMSVS